MLSVEIDATHEMIPLPENPDLSRRLNEIMGSAAKSTWAGPPGQQRDIALKARRPFFTNSLCIRIWAAAQGFRLGFSALEAVR